MMESALRLWRNFRNALDIKVISSRKDYSNITTMLKIELTIQNLYHERISAKYKIRAQQQ